MVNKSKGVNKEFLSITADFRKAYEEASKDVGLAILSGSLVTKKEIEAKVVKALTPIINDYFLDSIHASNRIVSKSVSRLADDIGLPFKYNRDLFDKINATSIWSGYADSDYKSLYSKRELTAMKKLILSGKYGDWDEKQLVAGIKNVANITNKNALLTARFETTRLSTVANEIYFSDEAVQAEYDLVWSQNSAYERHEGMNGRKANKDGMYIGLKGQLVPGPPYIESPWNCECTEQFVKKTP